MNQMGYNAMAVGLKELSLGPEVLRQRMREAQFPMLSANVLSEAPEGQLGPAYTILNIGGHRLGVVALTQPPTTPLPGFQVSEPHEALLKILPDVQKEADTIVLLTNLDYRSALELAQAVPGVDLVIAARPGQLPQQAVAVPGTGTLVVTAEQPLERHTGRRVGQLVVTVQEDGSLADPAWQSLPMTAEYADDPQMTTLLEEFRQ
jgi:5'-nucleotidase/UDP-sugar diphosphatase